MRKIRIGSGAGFSGDRIEPAVELVKHGKLNYICFECLAERTIALAQLQKYHDGNKGYNEHLEFRFRRLLPDSVKNKVTIITNMGAANPVSAAKKVQDIAVELGITGLKIAAVTGDDVLSDIIKYTNKKTIESDRLLSDYKNIVSANAYCGVVGILRALKDGANIIITGRVADPSLFLAPLVHEFEWSMQDYDKLGKGTLVGHLLECAAQVSGGYYADPGYKDVPDLWNLGFPIAEISENGDAVLSKLEGTGGIISKDTVTEQLLYEIHDPANYFTPDVIADFSNVTMSEIGPNTVLVQNASGKEKSGLLKTSVGYKDSWSLEGGISYGGSGALERAELAKEIICKRISHLKIPVDEMKIDLIGMNSLYGEEAANRVYHNAERLRDVRLRIAVRTGSYESAKWLSNEIESLYLNGPSGGCGVRIAIDELISVASILIPEEQIQMNVQYWEV